MNWYDNAIIYHIYPLGFCGAPKLRMTVFPNTGYSRSLTGYRTSGK